MILEASMGGMDNLKNLNFHNIGPCFFALLFVGARILLIGVMRFVHVFLAFFLLVGFLECMLS